LLKSKPKADAGADAGSGIGAAAACGAGWRVGKGVAESRHGNMVPSGSCMTLLRPSVVITLPSESKKTNDGIPRT
jgi:hypothetical protein